MQAVERLVRNRSETFPIVICVETELDVMTNSQDTILISDPLVALRRFAGDVITGIAPREFRVIETASNAAAVELAEKHEPSLVILEIVSAELSGFEAAARIWQARPQAKILLWTQYNRNLYIRELQRIVNDRTVYGCVLKDLPEDKLAYAISSIWLHENPYVDPRIRQQLNSTKETMRLTEREFEVLQDIALGLTEKAIARRRNLTIRGVQSRAAAITSKLLPDKNRAPKLRGFDDEIFSRRALVLSEAVRNGLIEPESLKLWRQDLDQWLQNVDGNIAQI